MNPNKITLKKLKEISVPDFGDFVNHTKKQPHDVSFEEITGEIISKKGKKDYNGACATYEHPKGFKLKHSAFGQTPEDLKEKYDSLLNQENQRLNNYLSKIKY